MGCHGHRARSGAVAAAAPALLMAGCDPKTVPAPEPKTGPRIEQPGSAPRGGTTGAVQPGESVTRPIADSGEFRGTPPR